MTEVFKHTPGPWEAGYEKGWGSSQVITAPSWPRPIAQMINHPDCYYTHKTVEINGERITSFNKPNEAGEARKSLVEAEGKANAALMSAAPDLLDALKCLVARYEPEDAGSAFSPDPGCTECTHGVTPITHQTGPCPMHKALKAIAKAEGRS